MYGRGRIGGQDAAFSRCGAVPGISWNNHHIGISKDHTHQTNLSFTSHHSVTHTVVVVRTVISRPNTLSSSGVQRVEEEKIVDALKENGYHSSFIHKHSCPAKDKQEVDERRPRMTVTLPYINGLSQAVRRILTKLEIKVVFHPLSASTKSWYTLKTQYHWSL